MNDISNDLYKGIWSVCGGTLLGLGVGFFFLQESALVFIGCILGGVGLGFIITAILSTFKNG